MVVDSFLESDGVADKPAAIQYLESIGVEPDSAVRLIVATHWHDDHIGGMAQLVARCPQATFVCSAALCKKEFLAAIGPLSGRNVTVTGSGAREIRALFSVDRSAGAKRDFALANRLLLRQGNGEVWALSPDSGVFETFLVAVSELMAEMEPARGRLPALSPNEASVVLSIHIGDIVLLLGADLEKNGWKTILENSSRPAGRASVFKLPHHGSQNAHHDDVWDQMLVRDPVAVVAPWTLGGRILPRRKDVERILSRSDDSYSTVARSSMSRSARFRHRHSVVRRAVQGSDIELRRDAPAVSGIRLRRKLEGSTGWIAEELGAGCRLRAFY